MQVTTAADQLFFVTAFLVAEGDDSTWTGTGFAYGVETEKGTAHFLITNRHVVEKAVRLRVHMIRSDGAGGPALGQRTDIRIVDFNPDYWVGHPDADVDVVAMPLYPLLVRMEDLGRPAFFRSVAPELCLTSESEKDLDSIEEVTFVGYPSGIYDQKNLLPVARKGTTATPPAVDYNGLPAFLIDASVFPGSSGSPVFIADKGLHVARSGNVVLGKPRLLCLGLVAAVHVRKREGQLFQLETAVGVSIDEPLDLGIVYKSSTFEACVQPLLDRAGLERVTAAITTPGEPSQADQLLEQETPPAEG